MAGSSTEVHIFQVTIPTGTAKASPQKTALTLPRRTVNEIEIVIPDGPRGEVGFALGSSGVKVFPAETGTYIVTNDEKIKWELSELWDSGGWEAYGYNTGTYAHTIEVRFLTSPTQSDQVQGAPLDLAGQQLPAIPVPSDLGQLPAPPDLPPFTLPPTPGLPSLGGPGAQSGAHPPAPTLTPTEDTAMRFAKYQRPDGTIDYMVLLSDTTLNHYTTFADSRPKGRSWPPGNWVAITEFGTFDGGLYLRGVGLDKKIWQTTAPIADTLSWTDPVAVIA